MSGLVTHRLLLFILAVSMMTGAVNAKEDGEDDERMLLARSDSLFTTGVAFYRNEEYRKAIPFFAQCDSIDKASRPKGNRQDYAAMWLASCYYHLGDTTTAQNISPYYSVTPADLRLIAQSDSLLSLAYEAWGFYGDIDTAMLYAMQCVEGEKDAPREERIWYSCCHPNHGIVLHVLSVNQSNSGNYAEAVLLAKKEVDIWERVCAVEDNEEDLDYWENYYATSLSNLAWYQNQLGNYQEAAHLREQADTIEKKLVNKALALNDRADQQATHGNYEEAVQLQERALAIYKQVSGTEDDTYAILLYNQIEYQAQLGNYTEAVRLGRQALTIWDKVDDTEKELLTSLLINLAWYQNQLGNYQEAVHWGEQAIAIKESLGIKDKAYLAALNKLAVYQTHLANYTEAIRLEQKAIDIMDQVFGTKDESYAASLNNLSLYQSQLGNYAEAIQLQLQAIAIKERCHVKEDLSYAISLGNLGFYYAQLGNYREAIRLEQKAKDIKEQKLKTMKAIQALQRNTDDSLLAGAMSSLSSTEQEIITMYEAYAQSLENLAAYQGQLGNYEEALQLQKRALNIEKKSYGTNHPIYAQSLGNLAIYQGQLGNYEEAIELAQQEVSIADSVLGKEHPLYAASLSSLANLCYKNAPGRLNLFAQKSTYAITHVINKTFSTLSANRRSTFWSAYESLVEASHTYAFGLPSDTLSANGYNAALLSKGLLLNSEIEFTKLILESGDEETLALFKKLKGLKNQISKLIEKPIPEQPLDVDSLSREADKVEQQLVDRSKVYGDYTANLVITWEQVQEKLTDKDIAVEFVSFPLNADSTMYIAYALKKDWECPKMIPLFEEKQLLAVQKGDRYTTDSISRLVWKPLDDVMQGVERVYFAPSGELYNIAIESIPTHEDGGETLVGEHRDFYRLSSTRELALIKDESRWDEAAVYGGLQYGMSVKGMIEEDGKYEKAAGQKRGDSTPSYYVVREDSIGRGDRDVAQGLAYLEGTKREAEAITHDLERKAVDARLFTDSIGTETSFKALGGKKTSIIHIGTHGFFNDRKKEYKDDKLQLLGIDQQAKVIEDDALTRSGLYFAGADNVILNGLSAVPDSVDDGRLTAAEIAQLDLRGLDMVVLSACQTGLGEITGDGVFGLQRGFKKAGAQTIVMSLWKVDDDATTEFMTTFFENMKIDRDGHPLNKHEAFKEAQSKLKRDKDKYSDPYCWAAFVMLDGIN